MPQVILFPISREHVDEAMSVAPALAERAREHGARVLVLQTECLHGLLTDIAPECIDMETRRIHLATQSVVSALQQCGAEVDSVWECVQTPRRPVDTGTVERLGADAVYVVRHGGLGGLVEALALRRLRRRGVTIIQHERPAVAV